MKRRPTQRPEGADPTWYKDAIIYEIRTRSFFDADGDGIGDIAGLTEKLDYLQDLGVNALWLLPICPSPGRDDGYDIGDYMGVHPEVGTVEAFRAFIDAAHARGIYVITELVLNHTSDQHPWFQRARRAPAGSPERDFYVWSDTPERYLDARVIFQDFEPSNWTWDPVARAYFWHRFYAHQPDLNFENPAVHTALFEVVDFWFGLGVDGLRLDAVPYLYESEGTSCENLPATHAFLKRLRAHVDAKFASRMLLAEANQWPEDAASYFGDGDECHMNFHFPIMPRMFMALRMEDRFPIVDILAQTPELPPACQWALFLRNHDELTLEMVTDEERDYMYRAYARDSRMRINLGIRRRLAPLVGNDRRKMELLHGLLFSLPGTPVLYYGDEIGMGDNVYLGDRNGVRTPMQWSADRNAGFSRANPQRLILPVIIDPAYHYEAVNVEAQQESPSSLLWWTKRLIALRKRSRAFGRGTLEMLHPDNPRVLAFVRRFEEEAILVVANLSRFPQYVEMDLARFRGMVPVELFGHVSFPAVGETPYMLTLGGHAFYWFSLTPPEQVPGFEHLANLDVPEVTESLDELLDPSGEASLVDELLTPFFDARPWLTGHRRLSGLELVDAVRMPADQAMLVLRADFAAGEPQTLALPVAVVDVEADVSPSARVGVIAAAGGARGQLVDAAEDTSAAAQLVRSLIQGGRFVGPAKGAGEVVALASGLTLASGGDGDLAKATRLGPHTVRVGEGTVVRFLRGLEEGVSPELETARFLAARGGDLVPPLVGELAYRARGAEPSTFAVIEELVQHAETARDLVMAELGRAMDRALARPAGELAIPSTATPLGIALGQEPPELVRAILAEHLITARRLGERMAELHTALAEPGDAFGVEPYTTLDRRSLYQTLRNLSGTVLRSLRAELPKFPEEIAARARRLGDEEGALHRRFEPLLSQRLRSGRIRIHGDLALDKILWTGRTFVFVGASSGRTRAAPERRRRRSALRDVAALVGSLHDASLSVLDERLRPEDRPAAAIWAEHARVWAEASLVNGYLAGVASPQIVPDDFEELHLLLDLFMALGALHTIGGVLAARARRGEVSAASREADGRELVRALLGPLLRLEVARGLTAGGS